MRTKEEALRIKGVNWEIENLLHGDDTFKADKILRACALAKTIPEDDLEDDIDTYLLEVFRDRDDGITPDELDILVRAWVKDSKQFHPLLSRYNTLGYVMSQSAHHQDNWFFETYPAMMDRKVMFEEHKSHLIDEINSWSKGDVEDVRMMLDIVYDLKK